MYLEEIFYDLLACYSVEQAGAFLQGCYLMGESDALEASSFNQLVYKSGNQSEIYTKKERDFIHSWKSSVGVHSFLKSSGGKNVPCRCIAAHLDDTTDVLLQVLAFMKICNKALDGFNTFFFVHKTGIQFGCLQANTVSESECLLTPVLDSHVDWDEFHYSFLYRDDQEDLFGYIRGIINTFAMLPECIINHEPATMLQYYSFCRFSDDDPADLVAERVVRKGVELSLSKGSFDSQVKTSEAFEQDVQTCLSILEYIKSNRVNTLEMLYEAEEAEAQYFSGSGVTERGSENNQPIDEANPALPAPAELFEDPIELVKKLKSDRGIT